MTDSQSNEVAMTFIVAGCVVQQSGKYLLVQEKQPKAYGLWNLPGGRVDKGETLEQAAVREAKEECGLDVVLTGHLITLHQAVDRPVIHAFSAQIVGGAVQFPEDEILDAQWFSYDEIVTMTDQLRNAEYILGAIETTRQPNQSQANQP